ncbi:MAG: YdhR family protein [Burkholderiaceae bacterium]
MITTIVEFRLPTPMSAEQAREVFLNTAPKYRGMAGLIRKYYWVAPDGATAGGIYLWNSRADADAVSPPMTGRPSSPKNTAARRH